MRMLGPYHKKEERTVCLRITAKIDVSQQWAANNTDDEILQQLKSRFDSALGFRGELKGLKIKVVILKPRSKGGKSSGKSGVEEN